MCRQWQHSPGKVSPLCERVDASSAWNSPQKPCRTRRRRAHGAHGCANASSSQSYPWTSWCIPDLDRNEIKRITWEAIFSKPDDKRIQSIWHITAEKWQAGALTLCGQAIVLGASSSFTFFGFILSTHKQPYICTATQPPEPLKMTKIWRDNVWLQVQMLVLNVLECFYEICYIT